MLDVEKQRIAEQVAGRCTAAIDDMVLPSMLLLALSGTADEMRHTLRCIILAAISTLVHKGTLGLTAPEAEGGT